jgi:hypothetical protein
MCGRAFPGLSPELDPLIDRGGRIAFGHPSLHLGGAPNSIHDTGKLRQHSVAGILHDAATVLRDLRIDQLTEMGLEPFVRPLLVRTHQARVAGHIGGEDRGETADGKPFVPAVDCRPSLPRNRRRP